MVVISCLMSRIPTLKNQKRNFNGSVYCAYNDTVYEILYEFASHLGGREGSGMREALDFGCWGFRVWGL